MTWQQIHEAYDREVSLVLSWYRELKAREDKDVLVAMRVRMAEARVGSRGKTRRMGRSWLVKYEPLVGGCQVCAFSRSRSAAI